MFEIWKNEGTGCDKASWGVGLKWWYSIIGAAYKQSVSAA